MHKNITLILFAVLVTGSQMAYAADDPISAVNLALNRPVKSFSSLGDLPDTQRDTQGRYKSCN
ncbi:MAG: hypothetical protein ABR915_01150 [Thermoguttaceae bacterium]|jgi:hypothetical protein